MMVGVPSWHHRGRRDPGQPGTPDKRALRPGRRSRSALFAVPLAAVVASGVAITAWSAGAGPSLPAYVNVAATRARGALPTSTARSSPGPRVPGGNLSGPGAPTTPPVTATARTRTRAPATTSSFAAGSTTTTGPAPATGTVAATGVPVSTSRTTVIAVVVVPRLEGDNGQPQGGGDDHGANTSGRASVPTHGAPSGTLPASQPEVGHDN